MKIFRWLLGTIIPIAALAAILVYGGSMFEKWFYIFSLTTLTALWRLLNGPTKHDRLLAFNTAGTALLGFCAILSVALQNEIYIDIAIAWLLQTYFITFLLSKHFEGRKLND